MPTKTKPVQPEPTPVRLTEYDRHVLAWMEANPKGTAAALCPHHGGGWACTSCKGTYDRLRGTR